VITQLENTLSFPTPHEKQQASGVSSTVEDFVCRRWYGTKCKSAAFFLPLLLAAFGPASVSGQTLSVFDGATPVGLAPGSPAGASALSRFEYKDPFSGNLGIAIPLYHVGGRGDGGFDIVWNFAQTWVAAKRYGGSLPAIPIRRYIDDQEVPAVGGLEIAAAVYIRTGVGFVPCTGPHQAAYGPGITISRIIFRTPNGSEVELIDQNTHAAAYTNANACTISQASVNAGRGTVFNSTDGSAIQFISDSPVLDYLGSSYAETDTKANGLLLFPNGVTYRIDYSCVSWIRDRNGNTTTFDYAPGHGSAAVGSVPVN
jgi:hypothetical protein